MKGKAQIDWPAVARELARRIPLTALHPAAMSRLRTGRVAVAFSGGADSLALLLLLRTAMARKARGLVALHFNHRLRGRAADADEKFCAAVCRGLGVDFVSARWRDARPDASEADSRAARHAFFRQAMSRRRIRLLCLGHQQDDIAETMLMRLARGSGAAGLAAPRPAQPMPAGRWHLRPLLTLKKRQIEQALRQAGAVWREDASNQEANYFRNRVRRAVLPAWVKASGRDALAGAALARELLEEDDTALEAWATRLGALRRGVLDVAALHGCPRAVVRRLLRRWLVAVAVKTDLSRQGFEELLDAVEQGHPTRFSLGRTHFAVIRRGRLTLKRG